MVLGRFILPVFAAAAALAQDPREIVRRSIAQDQLDWMRMKDYTWQAQSVERHFDSHGKVQSTKREKWETLILYGQPQRRMLEKDGSPLSPQELRNEDKKLDEASRKLSSESPSQKLHRLEESNKLRKREFAFLSEIPELFDLRLEGESTLSGRRVWIVSGAPRPGAQARSRDARMLLKVRGRLWIDQLTFQWAKAEAQTTGTISWGVFLARLDPGSWLTFEQTQVNNEIWLPKRLYMTGSGRLGLIKRLSQDEEIQWSDYRKFSVESGIVTTPPAAK
jgi:hypothetical protein